MLKAKGFPDYKFPYAMFISEDLERFDGFLDGETSQKLSGTQTKELRIAYRSFRNSFTDTPLALRRSRNLPVIN